jgi:protease I
LLPALGFGFNKLNPTILMFASLFRKSKGNSGELMIVKKTALMVIAPQNFRDEECFETKEELENAGIAVTIASLTKGDKKGKLGGSIFAEKSISEVNVEDYNAVVFIGGQGASIYFKNPIALDIARQSYKIGKVVAAICIAPIILANAGILSGKSATAYEDEESKAAFIKARAVFTGKSVEVDGKIVTGNGPKASREFGKKIAELI